MIVKIDHLAFCPPFSKKQYYLQMFKKRGYRLSFVEKGIKNLPNKRSLMRFFSPRHSLVMLVSEGNISLEMIDHGHTNKNASCYSPILGKLPSSQKKSKLNKIIVKTKNLQQSVSFWENLGFKRLFGRRNMVEMEFVSALLRKPYQLYLQKTKNNRKYFLDDAGFNCLALISSSAEEERKRLKTLGIEVTPLNQIKINNKRLKIFFVVGPSGELVEIIGLCFKKF